MEAGACFCSDWKRDDTEDRKIEYYDGGEIPWINTGDLNDGELEVCGKRITEKAIADHASLRVYPAGSLLIAMYGATTFVDTVERPNVSCMDRKIRV